MPGQRRADTHGKEKRMQIRWNRALLTLAALLLLAGCASQQSSTPPDVWRDPNYAGPPFKKVFVIGLSSKDLTDRRGFEDLMVGKLQAGGVEAVPAWQFLPNSGQADRDTMMAAYARSGADAVLLARFMGFATKDAIVPAPVLWRRRGDRHERRRRYRSRYVQLVLELVRDAGHGHAIPGGDDLHDAVQRQDHESRLDLQPEDLRSAQPAATGERVRERSRRFVAIRRTLAAEVAHPRMSSHWDEQA
jgi:hypothetical protein